MTRNDKRQKIEKIPTETFQRFFYYGIENKGELEEGLVHFTIKQVEQEYGTKGAEEKLQKYEEQLQKIFRQYKRFILLAEDMQKYQMDISEEELQREVHNRIDSLIKEDKIKKYGGMLFYNDCNTKWLDGYSQEISQSTYHEERKKIQQNIYERTYSEVHEIGNGRYIGYCAPNWSKRVYNVLVTLSELEEQDKVAYYEKWLEMRLARSKNRRQVYENEVKIMEKIKEEFNKRKQVKEKEEPEL